MNKCDMTNDSNPVFEYILPKNSIIIADGFYAQSFIIILLFVIVELLFSTAATLLPPPSVCLYLSLSLPLSLNPPLQSLVLILYRLLPFFVLLSTPFLYSSLLSITRFPSIQFILHVANNKQYLGKKTH